MSYVCDLAEGLQLVLANAGEQTSVSLSREREGSGQRQARSFTTGEWTGAPQVRSAGERAVVTLHTGDGPIYVTIENDRVELAKENPALEGGTEVALREGSGEEAAKMKPMEPMKAMEPMRAMKPMQPLT